MILDSIANIDIKKILFGSILIGAGYYYNFFNGIEPLEKKISQLNIEVEKETLRKKDTEKTMLEQDRMRENVVQLSEEYQRISKKLPSNLKLFDLHKIIDQFSQEANVLVSNRVPMNDVKVGLYDEIAISIDVEGEFQNLTRFIYLIATTERLGKVKNISIKRKSIKDPLKMVATVVGFKIVSETALKEKEVEKKDEVKSKKRGGK